MDCQSTTSPTAVDTLLFVTQVLPANIGCSYPQPQTCRCLPGCDASTTLGKHCHDFHDLQAGRLPASSSAASAAAGTAPSLPVVTGAATWGLGYKEG
jgi:hypothetical protein